MPRDGGVQEPVTTAEHGVFQQARRLAVALLLQGAGQLRLAVQGIEVVFAQQARMHFQHLLLHAARRVEFTAP
ncbi:hypothetical protein D3C80_2130940 [compost metagenome]